MTADPDARKSIASACASVFRWRWLGVTGRAMLRKVFTGGERLRQLVEGPIDKCGLAYFLCAKLTSLCTIGIATVPFLQAGDNLSSLGALLIWLMLPSQHHVQACQGLCSMLATPCYAGVRTHIGSDMPTGGGADCEASHSTAVLAEVTG